MGRRRIGEKQRNYDKRGARRRELGRGEVRMTNRSGREENRC